MLRDEEDDCYSTALLQIVQVQGDEKLLVVTCNYRANKHHRAENTDTLDIDTMFVIAPDSIEFHLIEAIAPSNA